jgi:hypothetical protein
MAMAVLSARLYAASNNRDYLASMIATAKGIAALERTSSNVLIDDRDAFTNGWAAFYYATEVVPLLTISGTADASTILATAQSVMTQARSGDGTYSGNWSGPFNGSWARAGSTNFRLNVSASAAMWPIAAAALAGVKLDRAKQCQ